LPIRGTVTMTTHKVHVTKTIKVSYNLDTC
jgi:hypothetical protein